MPVPALLAATLKRRMLMRLISTVAGVMVPVLIMAMCAGLAVTAAGAQGTTACLAPEPTAAIVPAPAAGLVLSPRDGPPITLSPGQVAVARSYIGVGKARGVSDAGVQIAIMMSLQESGLRILANPSVPTSMRYAHDGVGSDHDSIGTAQQRPSSGWGSVTELMDPVYDAQAFYGGADGPNHESPSGLLDVPGWETMPKGDAAQAVQRAAFPELYSQWESEAGAILAALKPGTSLQNCSSDGPTTGATRPTLPRDLTQVRRDIIHYAEVGLGGQYVWGGTTFKAWDCSGYVQWIYWQIGIQLPRTEQWLAGTSTTTPQPGDLVVQNPDGPNHWGHVGIYAGNGMMYSALNPAVGTLIHPVAWNTGSRYFVLVRDH